MIENKIKNLIISRYGSLSSFCKKINLPCSTVDSILKRGIAKANVLNVIKICNELGLSVDNLKHGIVEPADVERVSPEQFATEVKFLLSKTNNLSEQQKQYLLNTLDIIINEDK